MRGFYISALDAIDKEKRLLEACNSLITGRLDDSIHQVKSDDMGSIPGKPIAYWCSAPFYKIFRELEPFSNEYRGAYVGLQTSDDFRFVRLNWEVDLIYFKHKWYPFAKGGEYLPYYSDIHLCVDWKDSGYSLKNFRNSKGKLLSRPQNTSHYLREGITWPERTTSGFCPQVMPKGTIFSQVGLGMFLPSQEETIGWLLVLHTRVYQYIAELLIGLGEETVSGSAGRHYTCGLVSKYPYLEAYNSDCNISHFKKLYDYASFYFIFEETSHRFDPEWLVCDPSLDRVITRIEESRDSRLADAYDASKQIEKSVRSTLNLHSNTLSEVFNVCGPHPTLDLKEDLDLAAKVIEENRNLKIDQIINNAVSSGKIGRAITKKTFFVDRDLEVLALAYDINADSLREANKRSGYAFCLLTEKDVAYRQLSYLIGIAFGRFDKSHESLDNSFHPFEERKYFPRVVDEPMARSIYVIDENGSDLVEEIEELALHYSSKGSEFINSMSHGLGSKTIRDILVKPGEYFSFHLSQYSKSRRQAPIYWPLQTKTGDFTLWVYYHRLNQQTLYNCVNNYIDPKLKDLDDSIASLRSKSARTNQDDKVFSRLTDLISDLKDFRDELLRITQFWKPNLNDGVQITAAALWKLFQHKAWQKKLKKTWEELEQGKYDWSHMAYNIWPERVLRKCHQDRSIAIAHDVEADLWEEAEAPAARGKGTKWVWQPKAMSEAELDAYIQQKIAKG